MHIDQTVTGGSPVNREALPAVSLCCGVGQYDTRKPTLSDGRPNPMVGQPWGTIDLAAVWEMMQKPPVAAKGTGQWMLASSYAEQDARKFDVQETSGSYSVFLVDIDEGNLSLDRIKELCAGLMPGIRALIYSSASAQPDNRKWHIIFPLAFAIPYDAFAAYQRALFAGFQSNGATVDHSLARAAQPYYLPSVKFAANDLMTPYYECVDLPGGLYEPGGLTTGSGWLDHYAQDLFWKAKEERARTSSGHGPHSIIGWVNSHFVTEALFEEYGYVTNGKDWASPYQQASGRRHGAFVRPDNSWFSHSNSDRAAGVGKSGDKGQNGDAFDLIKHFAFAGDEAAALQWAVAERQRQQQADPHMQQLRQVVEGMLK